MAKRRNKNKNKNRNKNNHNSKKRKVFHLTPIVIAFILILSLLIVTVNHFKNSSYFTVRQIISSDIDKQENINRILDLKEKNIFSLDLKTISNKLKDAYPEISQIIVSRIFPDRLIIEFKERIPVAKLALSNKEFFIDEDAVILGYSKAYDKAALPNLEGLNIAFKDLSVGQQLRSKNVSFALGLLKQINDVSLLRQYKVSKLDVSNLNKISFTIHGEVVILIRKFDFNRKISILVSLLKQLGPELDQISYIDLRFKDPVIKKR